MCIRDREYYDSANEVSERISYPDDDSANYANQIASALNSEISVTNLTEQGDSNVDDGEIKRLGYEQQEKNLVQMCIRDRHITARQEPLPLMEP